MNKTTKNVLIGTASSALVALFAWLFHRTEKPTPVASEPAPAPVTQPVELAKKSPRMPQPVAAPPRKPMPIAKPVAAPQPKPMPVAKPVAAPQRKPVAAPQPKAVTKPTPKPVAAPQPKAVTKPTPKPVVAPQPKLAQTEKDLFKDRRVIIDGTNVCFWRKRERGCLSLGDLLAICMDLHRRGVEYKAFFDASTRYRLRDSGEAGDKELYLALLAEHPDRFCEVNRGESADLAVLEAAAATPAGEKPALILARDNYFEHRARFPFAGDASRRLWGEICSKGIYFRKFDWLVKLGKAA